MLYDDIAFGLALSLHSATTNQDGLKSWSVHCQRKRSRVKAGTNSYSSPRHSRLAAVARCGRLVTRSKFNA
ncbi:hypothetical protein V497_07823 [Pseudogymnoascus sp. VKM F-4516 (FW-969)]|nr:hypothetical protein V497_07823 [Pseudogymnoascus sp. VKM F-4516 (FW-969)]